MSEADVAFDEAGSVVLAALAAIVVRFDTAEHAAIADEADAVHQARILVRRLRSVLAVFEPLFDAGQVRRLRSALEELGDELGDVRDIEVRVEHAERHLGESTPVEVRERLVEAEQRRYRAAHDDLIVYLRHAGDERRRRVADFIEAPLFTERATERAPGELAHLLKRQCRRLAKAGEHATGDLGSLHRLRRAARRLRYACDAVCDEPAVVFGDEVRQLSAAAQGVQDVLGDHRDELLFALQVRRAQASARESGEAAEAYAVVAEDAFVAAAARLEELPAALRVLRARMRAVRSLD
jgi:CHAD domain-containing protein